MFHPQTAGFTDSVYPAEPGFHPGIKGHVPAQGLERVPGKADASPGLFPHHIHIGQNAVRVMLLGKLPAQGPEFLRRGTDAGHITIFLHIARAQGLIKIVNQRGNGFFHPVPSLFVKNVPTQTNGDEENLIQMASPAAAVSAGSCCTGSIAPS